MARGRASIFTLVLVGLVPAAALAQDQAIAYQLGAADRFFGPTIALDDSAGRLSVQLVTAAYVTLLRILPGQRVEAVAASEPLPAGLVSVPVPEQRYEVRGAETVTRTVPSARAPYSDADVQRCVQREMAFWRQASAPRPGLLIDGTRPAPPSAGAMQAACGGSARQGAAQSTTVRRAPVVRAVSDYLLVVVSEGPLNDTSLVRAMQARADLTVEAVGEELARMAGEQGPAWAAWLIRR